MPLVLNNSAYKPKIASLLVEIMNSNISSDVVEM